MPTIKNRYLKAILRYAIPFLLIPLVAILGETLFDAKKHIFVSLTVAVLVVLLFITGFERKELGTRRMVIVAIMTALSVVGRFIPFFKPITAITIISAMYLGCEAGFTVGAFSALLSNFYFGQGPWTPFQMLSWGLIGFIAGCIAEPLRRSRPLLLLYGVLSGIAYSLLMDVWTVLGNYSSLEVSLYLAAITTALPYTVLYSVSNLIFLTIMAKPFGDKLGRIKLKYGV